MRIVLLGVLAMSAGAANAAGSSKPASLLEPRFASTIYMVGVSFGHSLGLAILSPVAGALYDRIGFQHTYFVIAGFALCFWIASFFTLAPTPPTDASGVRRLDRTVREGEQPRTT